MKDYSQYGEYTFLKVYLPKLGSIDRTIVDVGAKGVEGSNSYNLIKENNWQGILIEPELRNYQELINTYIDVEGTVLCNVAVTDLEGYRDFYISNIKGHHSLIRKTNTKVKIYTATLKSILDCLKVGNDFGILDVDAEGMDFTILNSLLNTSAYRPKIILHEKDYDKNIFYPLLQSKNYYVIYETTGNIIWRLSEN